MAIVNSHRLLGVPSPGGPHAGSITTTLEAIVAAGRELLEEGGVGAVTMLEVAYRVGVRAPSLYKRVRDRDQLFPAGHRHRRRFRRPAGRGPADR